MKFISLLFHPDGTYAGTYARDALVQNPPPVQIPAPEGAPRKVFIYKHVGMLETDGSDTCPSFAYAASLETRPGSTAANPNARIKAGHGNAPLLIAAPAVLEDVGPFVAKHGVKALPHNARAWITLVAPAVAAEHGIDAGITLHHQLAVEKLRHPVNRHQCRIARLTELIEQEKAAAAKAVVDAGARQAEDEAWEKRAAADRAEDQRLVDERAARKIKAAADEAARLEMRAREEAKGDEVTDAGR